MCVIMGGPKKILFFLAFVFFGVVKGDASNDTLKSSMLEKLLQFLEDGESQIILSEAKKDAIFMLGNTGSGKSTLTQWIATNNSQMYVTESGTGEYIIEDHTNKIGKSTVSSKTQYPDFFLDPESKTAFYDFSGFSDTRSTINDIATSYFIKKVVNYVERIKIVLVVSHPLVRKGVNRLGFRTLLKHTTELLKNVDKYVNGIALVATKVDNNYVWDKDLKKQVLVEDNVVIDNIGSFLQEVKEEFMETQSTGTLQSEEQAFYRNAIKLLSGLLTLDGQDFSKIGIFRRPDRPGLLSECPLLETGKDTIRHILANNIKFIAKDIDDFGFTVSEKSKNDIDKLVREMETSLKKDAKSLRDDLHNKFSVFIDRLESFIKKLDITSLNVDADFNTIRQHIDELREKYHDVDILTTDIKNMRTEDAISKIFKNMSVALEVNQKKISHLEAQEKLLDFLEKITSKHYNIDYEPLIPAFKETLTYLENKIISSEKSLEQLETHLDLAIKQNITDSLQRIKSSFHEQEENIKDINALRGLILPLSNTIKNAHDSNDPNEAMKLLNEVTKAKIFPQFISDRIIRFDKYFIFLKSELEPRVNFFENENHWYEFITKFYDVLSSNDYQTNSSRQSCSALIKTIDRQYSGKKVADTNIEFNLKLCSKLMYHTHYDSIKEVELNNVKINALYNVLDTTINNQLHISCNFGQYNIKGKIIKASEIPTILCPNMTVQSVDMFASDKIIIDQNINMAGMNLQLNIIAPTWEIIGNKNIFLDGFSGKSVEPIKANIGQDGQDGLPGKPGGNFLGIGEKFINGKGLSISTNGGQGGNGQTGGDGLKGKDGEVPVIAISPLRYPIIARPRNDVVEDWIRRGFSVSQTSSTYCSFPFEYCTKYHVMGRMCTNGGYSGCGGLGGIGGKAGKTEVYGDSGFTITQKAGRPGASGSGGSGGQPGLRGGSIEVLEKNECFVLFKEKSYHMVAQNVYPCQQGLSKDVCKRNHSYIPEDPPKFMDKKLVIDKYTSFFRDNYREFKKNFLDSFMLKLAILS